MPAESEHNSSPALGILVQFLTSFLATCGKISWRLAANAAPGSSILDALRHSKAARYLYLFGIVLTLVEPPLESTALSIAPVAIISACGGLSIFWNILLAPCILGEQLTRIRLGAAVLIFLGTLFVGVGGPHDEINYFPDEYFELLTEPKAIVYFCITGTGISICYLLWIRFGIRSAAVIGGAWLAGNEFIGKVCVELLKCGLDQTKEECQGRQPFRTWEIYVLATFYLGCNVLGLITLAKALRETEALDAITVYQAVTIIVGATSSSLVLEEQRTNSNGKIVLYSFALVIVLFALVMLAQRKRLEEYMPDADAPVACEAYDNLARSCNRRTDEFVGGALQEGDERATPLDGGGGGGRKGGGGTGVAAPTEGSQLLGTPKV